MLLHAYLKPHSKEHKNNKMFMKINVVPNVPDVAHCAVVSPKSRPPPEDMLKLHRSIMWH